MKDKKPTDSPSDPKKPMRRVILHIRQVRIFIPNSRKNRTLTPRTYPNINHGSSRG
jgi:hypothetical protein